MGIEESVAPLSSVEQLTALRSVLHNLQIGHVEQAHFELLDTLQQTPGESPLYPAMIETANWIHPLDNLHNAKCLLSATCWRFAEIGT